jgi:hypothetical protein
MFAEHDICDVLLKSDATYIASRIKDGVRIYYIYYLEWSNAADG